MRLMYPRYLSLLFSLLLLASYNTHYAQTQRKYFIYFRDKGENENILKEPSVYQNILKKLDPKAVERREKNSTAGIITYEDVPVCERYVDILRQNGVEIIYTLNWFNSVSAFLNGAQLATVKNLTFVDKVVPVKSLYFKSTDENQSGSVQNVITPLSGNYGPAFNQLALSDVTAVHSAGISGSGVRVGVLDTGFDWKVHESLKTRNVIAEKDFVFNDNNTANEAADISSQHNHGTYVFSVLAGYKDSAMIGAAYGASFLLAKTEDVRSEKHIEEDNYAAALEWMESKGVDITSGSLGYNNFDAGETSYTYENMDGNTAIITKAAELAFQKGVLTFSAAGNEGDDPWFYILAPSDGKNTIAVGAVSNEDSVALFSSRGPTADGRIKPELVTQGVMVYGARAGTTNDYLYNNGTSCATPIASGIAALLLSAYPHLTNVQMRSILLRASNNFLRPNNIRGYGLLSAKNAIEYPNVEISAGTYIIHKRFIDPIDGSNPVFAHFKAGSRNDSLPCTYLGGGNYSVTVPVYAANEYLKFRISYKSLSGDYSVFPAAGSLYYSYGSDIVDVYQEPRVVSGFEVSNNYPNPFNSGTVVSLNSAFKDDATVEIYDMLGRKIRTLYSGVVNSGANYFQWDGKDDKGAGSASGVYILAAKMGKNVKSVKMVLLH